MLIERDYIFEFAGMPKSGKTTVLDTVSHYFKRNGLHVQEYHGGGRYAPVDKSAIADLNLCLAARAAEFIVTISARERTSSRLFFMDRGLFDRCLFSRVLLRMGKIDQKEADAIEHLLTMPRLADRLDGVFLFTTRPDLSISREYNNKLVREPGRVMNDHFLETVRECALEMYNSPPAAFQGVHLIDTDKLDGQIIECANLVVATLSGVVCRK